MSWRYGEWSASHALPIGVATRADIGAQVRAGDIIAHGTTYGTPQRVPAARRLGVAAQDLGRVMRVPDGATVERGAIVARIGRRFARAVNAPIDGRIAHVRGDGDLEIAPVVDRWTVRATLDGAVTRSDDAAVVVEGAAWAVQAIAAYGPDAIGELAMAVNSGADELHPSRIDVRQRDRILFGGGRSGAEAITRAHACGISAVVAGAVPAGGLRVMFGDDVVARGRPTRADAPTVLCLLGFGSAPLPAALFGPLVSFAGARAAIHTASARLFVFAAPDVVRPEAAVPWVALAADWGSVRPLEGPAALAGEVRFASE
ncbi:MAG: hypothetical protein AAB295_07165, partial [Chloroflexota bacterium]